MNGIMWNLWHGCHKKSEGCKNCYVYLGDKKRELDANNVYKTLKFNLPVAKNKKGGYKYPSGTFFWTCFSSDFLLEDCDEWRKEAWKMIRERSDCNFMFITKRIERFSEVAPKDWGDGYDNVFVGVTAENQKRLDERFSIFTNLPIKHKIFIHEPLLEEIDISKYLSTDIQEVVVGGESSTYARSCNFDWILKIREECIKKDVSFTFKQTGSYLIKEGIKYTIPRKFQHSQAKKAAINYKNGLLNKGVEIEIEEKLLYDN